MSIRMFSPASNLVLGVFVMSPVHTLSTVTLGKGVGVAVRVGLGVGVEELVHTANEIRSTYDVVG